MTREQLAQRLENYRKAREELQTRHDEMVNKFKEQLAQNQMRFAQFSGAIEELTELTKLYESTTDNGSSSPEFAQLTGATRGTPQQLEINHPTKERKPK
jgi:hypothetical protein